MKKIISFALTCVMLLGCVFALASCGKSYKVPAEAVEILEKEGYTVYLNENPTGCKTFIYAEYQNLKKKAFEEIEIYYYEDEAAAEEAWKTLEGVFKAKAEAQDEDYRYEYDISGSLIYWGTPKAIKAAK